MAQAFFITGTDTGVGKTYVACQLIQDYVAQGYRVVGMKPVAAGCELVDGNWVNEDVKLLTQASNVKAPLHLINPYCFHPPIAPHIAAAQTGEIIDFQVIKSAFHELESMADIVIVEGAGGLLVPLNGEQTIADLIEYLDLPVFLVVGLKLGCINHARLTLGVIQHKRLNLQRVIANRLDVHMKFADENISAIMDAVPDDSAVKLQLIETGLN